MRTLDEILKQAASDLAILAEHGYLFGRGNQITLQKTAKLLADMVNELETTNTIEVK